MQCPCRHPPSHRLPRLRIRQCRSMRLGPVGAPTRFARGQSMPDAVALNPGRMPHPRSTAVAPAPVSASSNASAATTASAPGPHASVQIGNPRQAWTSAATAREADSRSQRAIESRSESRSESNTGEETAETSLRHRRCAWITFGGVAGGILGGLGGWAGALVNRDLGGDQDLSPAGAAFAFALTGAFVGTALAGCLSRYAHG